MIRILTEPRNALVKQYQKLFELDGVNLEFQTESLTAIARESLNRKTGARGLRSILEDIMRNVMYEIPSHDSIGKCVITSETVVARQDPIMITTDRKKKKVTA